MKQHYYLDLYVSQVKIFLDGDLKYNILEAYSFNDVEEEESDLRELERDLMLDEDYLDSLRNKEEEKQKIVNELEKYKNTYSDCELKIKELEKYKNTYSDCEFKIKELENAIQSLN